MDFELTPDQQDLVTRARAFSDRVLAPNADAWEDRGTFAREAFAEAIAAGFVGFQSRRDHGGADRGFLETALVYEQLARGCLPTTFGLIVHNNAARSVSRLGTPEQIARWGEPLTAGRLIGGFALTEPGAGSDAAAIQLTAIRDGGDWVLNGTKAWVSLGGEADLYHVYAKTAPDLGARGISDIVVEKSAPGLRFGPKDRKLGANALPTCQLIFENCRVPAGNRLGPENGAFRLGLGAIDAARVFVGALCAGIGQAALDHAVAYARGRRAFGQAIGEFQGIQWLLADLATEIEAGRLLTYKAAALLDAGRPATIAAAHAKRFGADLAARVTDRAMQVFGANGYSRDYPVERYFRWAKLCAFVDGTTQIQQIVIARSLLRD